jgi:2-dehydropantoate 2-reductase
MRYVIFGAGAIGGLVGARLHQSGHEVLLIARGAHHDAIARDGLTMLTPSERETFKLPVARDAASAGLRPDDVVLLCVKSQDTWNALMDLRDAAPTRDLPIVCLQNAVENERMALRMFANVYGSVVLIPAEHLEPGVVVGYGSKLSGRIDIGRYPDGTDSLATEISEAIRASRFDSDPHANIMVHKYAKLINNLGNGVQAICGVVEKERNRALTDRVQEEGRAVLRAAGIEFDVPNVANVAERWARIEFGEVGGQAHQGGSTWQSVKRGAGNVETDYLNGEIVLLARQLGLPCPLNETVQILARETLIRGLQPGWLAPEEVLSRADGRSSAVTG